MRARTPDPKLGATVLEALPLATLLVDRNHRIVHANAAARDSLGARVGADLGAALGCVDGAISACGGGPRCVGCPFLLAVRRALRGEPARVRGFLLRSGEGREPGDLHLVATAAPLVRRRSTLAILVLEDANPLFADPNVLHICSGCGRVEDEDAGWHPLNEYVDDRLGIEAGGKLCPACAGGAPGPPRRV